MYRNDARILGPLLALLLLWVASARAQDPPDRREMDEARRQFPPELTRAVLQGVIPAPDGFDEGMKKTIGAERLAALRSGTEIVRGNENDAAAMCLLRLGASPEKLAGALREAGGPRSPGGSREKISVRFTESTYRAAPGNTSGFFRTGQPADILLSGIDFNDTGGPLLFNHPGCLAGDDAHLLLPDANNNRLLVWNSPPDANTAPDLVLGQPDFTANDPGNGRSQMNWPVAATIAGGKIAVADTMNHRILIWTHSPETNGAPADIVLNGSNPLQGHVRVSKKTFHWPWGVWTDGTRLAVTSTQGSAILIWNRFPTADDQPADLFLQGNGDLGTPRSISSDGTFLIVGDHNARNQKQTGGSFVWKTFPTKDDEPYDFFVTDPVQPGGAWLRGTFGPDKKLWLLGSSLHAWNRLPTGPNDKPLLSFRYNFEAGDHTGVVSAGGRLYISSGNANKIYVFRTPPKTANAVPDFAIGAPDLRTNTLHTNFILSNPVPVSNGKSLFVSSDFDRRLYVWKRLPDETAAHPDIVYDLDSPPWDNAIWKETLALAGQQTVHIWRKLPLAGEMPDISFYDRIGSVRFQRLMGIAMDDQYFFLADHDAERVYAWRGIPEADDEPFWSFEIPSASRMCTDGSLLTIAPLEGHAIHVFPLKDLGADTRPVLVGQPKYTPTGEPSRERRSMFNMAPSACVADGHLFVTDVGFSRVHAWRRIEDALAGKWADAILGEDDFDDHVAEIGRNKLFWPGAISFDGSYLWVGEVKFSERLLRFSPAP